MPENLGNHRQTLEDICFIEGIDLCSNIYSFVEDGWISIVDTGSWMGPKRISTSLERIGLRIENVARVVITHGHPDHIGGLAEILEHSSPKVFVHENDAANLEPFTVKSLNYMKDGEIVRLGTRDLRVLHTPGHTEGSVCLYDSELVLTGDTAFPGGNFGRTDLPSGSWRKLIDSLDRLCLLDVQVMLPGHLEPLLSNASLDLRLARKTAELIRHRA
jgi:glyoxylase-like metal-dependent hydrolase (beta-lactamase superfamily II)